jgi:hypothetical protein
MASMAGPAPGQCRRFIQEELAMSWLKGKAFHPDLMMNKDAMSRSIQMSALKAIGVLFYVTRDQMFEVNNPVPSTPASFYQGIMHGLEWIGDERR